MRRFAVAALLSIAGVAGFGSGVAQADPVDPSPTHSARTWHPPRPAARTWHPTTYRVQRGDTLWRIAVRMYGPSEHAGHQWTHIAEANHIQGTTIRTGQVLRIPGV